MTRLDSTVYVLDSDPATVEWLNGLFRHRSVRVLAFPSPGELMRAGTPWRPGCLIFDPAAGGGCGFGFLNALEALGGRVPVIVLSSEANVATAVRAMKSGAFDFFDKADVDGERLIEAVLAAITYDRDQLQSQRDECLIDRRLQLLTPREREIMELLVGGKTNKMIAFDLGLSPKTVETHRTKVFQKMQVRSLVELTRQVLGHALAQGKNLH